MGANTFDSEIANTLHHAIAARDAEWVAAIDAQQAEVAADTPTHGAIRGYARVHLDRVAARMQEDR